MADTLLSDLCSICNVDKSKYRCPGCAARTCSLPCYKRHQQWAQCSGKRDPTKYVKKSELATPAGIDHDFNFLSGIERDMERAEKTVDEKVQSKGQHQTQSLDRQLAAAGITVIRAPKGMSRQRENKTHRSKSGNKNVIWTVEWIDADKNRTITQTSSAEQIFRASPLYESPAQKRKRGAEKAAQKAAEKPDAEQQAEKQGTEKPQETTEKPQEATEKPQEATEKPQSDPSPNAPSDPTSVDTPTKPAYTPTHIFYLHRPRTSSAHPVLIPLDSATSLSEALTRRTVLEYPTIYMFAADAPLPEGYMLESAYLKQEGEEAAELEEMLGSVAPGVLKEEEGKEEVLDSQRLLDVLKADLGGAV